MLEESNILTVTQISSMIKRSVETAFSNIIIKGEVSSLKIHTSGHVYFSLKDENSIIDCVCWKFIANSQKLKLEEGIEIKCYGKITTYPERSKYQMVASKYEISGEGSLLKLLEERKKKLALEGLFDISRKKAIPKFPRKIAVVTSLTGAVIRDIIHRIRERFPTELMIYPVLVQGIGAAQQIEKAINTINSLNVNIRPDLIIVARGGGALEDLMPFNDEQLVRCVAASNIPIISAVGHETDTTLIDYAADLRAPTPTAAAEFAVQDKNVVLRSLKNTFSRLNLIVEKDLKYKESTIKSAKILPLESIIEHKMQRLDIIFEKSEKLYFNFINKMHLKIKSINLSIPKIINSNVENLTIRLSHGIDRILSNMKYNVSELSSKLELSSVERIFKQGFAYLESEDGENISSKISIKNNMRIKITLLDGSISCNMSNLT